MNKICTICKTDKPFDAFRKHKHGKFGLRAACKICANAKNKIYAATRKDEQKAYHEKHREKHNSYARQYHRTNKEKQTARRENDLSVRIKYILQACRQNARQRDIYFDVHHDFIMLLIYMQNNKCRLTGIEFDMTRGGSFRANPYAPSIDRIDNSRGYTADNIQIICHIVNVAKNEYPTDVFDTICRARVAVLGG